MYIFIYSLLASDDCVPHTEMPPVEKRRWSTDSSETSSKNSLSLLKPIKQPRLCLQTENDGIFIFTVIIF